MNPQEFLVQIGRVSFQSSVLVLLVLLVQWLFRNRLRARWRCALWGLVLVRLLMPVMPEARWSVFNWIPLQTFGSDRFAVSNLPVENLAPSSRRTTFKGLGMEPPAGEAVYGVPSANADQRVSAKQSAGVAATMEGFAGRDATQVRVGEPESGKGNSQKLGTASLWLVGIWAAVFVFLFSKAMIHSVRLNRRVRGGRRVEEASILQMLQECRQQVGVDIELQLVETEAVRGPALLGLWTPRLLLPLGYLVTTPAEELRFVILHELAHVKRRDIALNWLATLLQFLHWFNPVLWFAFSRYRADRELACDELALEHAGESSAEAYGRTILQLLRGSTRPSIVPGMVGISEDYRQLKERIGRIARFQSGPRWSVLGMGLCLGLAVIALTDARSADSAQTLSKLPPTTAVVLTNHMVLEENRDWSKPLWSVVPHGTNSFAGIEFHLDGLLQLQGNGVKSAGRSFRESIVVPVPTHLWGSVHLITGTSYDAEPGTRIAELIWRYADRTSRRVPIEYAVHTRDWWRAPYEEPIRVSNTNSKVVWRGEHPDAAASGKTLRLYKTTLANPFPARRVRELEFVSAQQTPSWIVAAVTLDPLPPGVRPDTTSDLERVDPPLTNHLEISVVEAIKGTPMEGVTVDWKVIQRRDSRDVSYTRRAKTDAGGQVVLDLPSTSLTGLELTASKEGLVSVASKWLVTESKPLPTTHRIALNTGFSIGGIVLDAEGNPIAGAPMGVGRYWTGSDERFPVGNHIEFQSKSTTTDGEGRWRVEGVPEELISRISVSVNHPDYLRRVVSPIGQDPVVLGALKELRHEFRLRKGFDLGGRVEDSEGNPIASAKVWFGRANFGNRRQTSTDERGEFLFKNLDKNVGDIENAMEPVSALVAGFDAGVTNIPMAEMRSRVVLRLEKGSVLRGRVVNESGEAMAGAQVLLQGNQESHQQAPWDFRTTTDAEGRFRWDGAPRESLLYTVFMEGYQALRDIRLQGVSDAEKVPEKIITLHADVVVTGQVLDRVTGKPVQRFTILPGSGQGGPFSSWSPSSKHEYAHDDGRFEFVLAEAEYNQIQLEAEDYAPQMVSIPSSRDRGIALPPIQLEPAPGVRGIVLDRSGQPAGGAALLFVPTRGPVLVGYTRAGFDGGYAQGALLTRADREGRFKFRFASKGPWRVIAMEDRGYVQATISDSGELPPLVLQPYGALEGTLTIAGQAAAGKKLVLQLEAGLWGVDDSLTALTDARGHFRMERVPPGQHTLFRSVPTGFFGRMNSHATSVQVFPGRTSTVNFLSPGALVSGVAVLPPEVSGITNLVRSGMLQTKGPTPSGEFASAEALEAWMASPEVQNFYRTRKDYVVEIAPDGQFLIDGVLPGNYRLILTATTRSMKQELSDETVATGIVEVEVPEAADAGAPIAVGPVAMSRAP